MSPHLLKNTPFAPCQAFPTSESEGYLFIRLSSPWLSAQWWILPWAEGAEMLLGVTAENTELQAPGGEPRPLQGNCTGGWNDSPPVEGTHPLLVSESPLTSCSWVWLCLWAAGTLLMPCAQLPVGRLLSSVLSPRWNRLTGPWFREGHSPRGSESSAESFGTSCRSLWIQQKVDSQNKLPKYFLQSVT